MLNEDVGTADAKPNVNRIEWIDAFRGLAIMLMIVYHFFYDLYYFGWYSVNVAGRSAWLPLRYIILTLFISLMAISIHRAHIAGVNYKKYGLWLVKIFAASFSITLITYFIFPHSWVFFGVLHFMAVCSVVVLSLRRQRVISCILGLAILVTFTLDLLPYGWPINTIRHWFYEGQSVDFVPLIPWLGVALIALSVSDGLYHSQWLRGLGARTPKFIKKLGRHSLLIYLIHQPLMFSCLYGLKRMLN